MRSRRISVLGESNFIFGVGPTPRSDCGGDATLIPTSAAIPRFRALICEEIQVVCHEESDHAVKIEN